MPRVIILIEGYLSNESGGRTCPTICLVQDDGLNIIVDPGTARESKLIIDALAQHDLEPEDIDIVFLTHSHYDHFKNIALFPAAKCRDYWGLWDNDICEDARGELTPNIKIINTPGHSYDSLTMLVKTQHPRGVGTPSTPGVLTTAICGDLWFKEDFPKVDPYAQNHQEIILSRQKVQEIASYIIPGHGKMFKNKSDTNQPR